jgi:hypothetical protein
MKSGIEEGMEHNLVDEERNPSNISEEVRLRTVTSLAAPQLEGYLVHSVLRHRDCSKKTKINTSLPIEFSLTFPIHWSLPKGMQNFLALQNIVARTIAIATKGA